MADYFPAPDKNVHPRYSRLLPLLEELFRKQQTYEMDRTGREFRSPLFDLAQEAKADPELDRASLAEALDIMEWFLEATGRTWTDFAGIDSDDEGRSQFLSAWEDVRFPVGADPLQLAWEDNQVEPAVFGTEIRIAAFHQFLGMGYWLQRRVGDRNILLPCRRVGAILGVSAATVSRFRRWAIEAGFLRVINAHTLQDATEFRFAIGKRRK